MVTEFIDMAKSFSNAELNNLVKKIKEVLKFLFRRTLLNHIQWVIKDGPSGAKKLNYLFFWVPKTSDAIHF